MTTPPPIVHFIGAGPGASDLITERGGDLLRRADLVVYAGSLVNPDHLTRCPSGCTLLDSAKMDLGEQVDAMSEAALNGKLVVRLHTGDPSMYGAIAEQIEGLAERGITPVIVPGVSSVFAAAAALKAELTYPGVSQSLILTRTPGRTPMPSGESVEAFARTGATLAFYLSMGNASDLMEQLRQTGLPDDTPAAIVYRASWPEERILRGTIATMGRQAEESGIGRQALILVGKALDAHGNRSKLYDRSFSHGYRNNLPGEQYAGNCASYAFTEKGLARAAELAAALDHADIFTTRPAGAHFGASVVASEELDSRLEHNWRRYTAHIFIGATGIAVRKIAPLLRDKTTDPAVVSCTESGSHLISLVSGHLGGANRLCRRLARITGGQAVVSTATDSRGIPSFDETAAQHRDRILNPDAVKELNAALLDGSPILLSAPAAIAALWENAPNVRTGAPATRQPGEHLVVWGSRLDPASIPPRTLLIDEAAFVLGIGCKKDTPASTLCAALRDLLQRHGLAPQQIASIATCDLKADEPAILALAEEHGLPLSVFERDRIAAIDTPTPSSTVQEKIGIPSVAEAAAILASGGHVAVPKTKYEGITLSLASIPHGSRAPAPACGRITVVGLGSGSPAHITPEVSDAIRRCDIVAGYTKYLDFIRDEIAGKPLIQNGMLGEVARCRDALAAAAEGKEVCMVCSGDPGVLAMAGLLYELRDNEPPFAEVVIRVLPGITAASLAAAHLGAPLQNGYHLISLSDLLVPTEEVRRNLTHTVHTALPAVLYNPAGRKRRHLMEEAVARFTEARGAETLCAIVRHAGRPQESAWIGTLAEFPCDRVDMSSLILIGGPRTRRSGDTLYEARGYQEKYLEKE